LWTIRRDVDVLIKTPFKLEKRVTLFGFWATPQSRDYKFGKIFESLWHTGFHRRLSRRQTFGIMHLK
jgi:hypothetical protein